MLWTVYYNFQKGALSIEQTSSVMKLIYKKDKYMCILKNLWLNLLISDYKIISKLLAKCPQKTLPTIISADQPGYLKDR